MKIKLHVWGCDDETEIELEVTDDELSLIRRIAEEVIRQRHYGCKPGMRVKELPDGIWYPED